jgi:hypothetical protein
MNLRTCSADTLVRETPEASSDKAMAHAILAVTVRSFKVLVAALQEIFDESAYQRFLDRSAMQSSVDAYAAFQQANEQAKSRRPRCC